jgi:hypothetical protein
MRFLLNLRTDAVLGFGAWGVCQRWGHREVQSANLAANLASDIMGQSKSENALKDILPPVQLSRRKAFYSKCWTQTLSPESPL